MYSPYLENLGRERLWPASFYFSLPKAKVRFGLEHLLLCQDARTFLAWTGMAVVGTRALTTMADTQVARLRMHFHFPILFCVLTRWLRPHVVGLCFGLSFSLGILTSRSHRPGTYTSSTLNMPARTSFQVGTFSQQVQEAVSSPLALTSYSER